MLLEDHNFAGILEECAVINELVPTIGESTDLYGVHEANEPVTLSTEFL